MERYPIKINICPISEAILEIRYKSEYPNDAIFGLIYNETKEIFKDKPYSLPILQLPSQIREQDPNLLYKPHHRLKKSNFLFNIGPRVLNFVNTEPYEGWKNWSEFFYNILGNIKEINVMNEIERVGLRYVNLFNDIILDKVKVKLDIIDRSLDDESTHFRTEIRDENSIIILQLGNSVNIEKDDDVIHGSIIDIDCINNIEDNDYFWKNYKDIIENSHSKEKKMFFSLLEESFIQKLEPVYGGKNE